MTDALIGRLAAQTHGRGTHFAAETAQGPSSPKPAAVTAGFRQPDPVTEGGRLLSGYLLTDIGRSRFMSDIRIATGPRFEHDYKVPEYVPVPRSQGSAFLAPIRENHRTAYLAFDVTVGEPSWGYRFERPILQTTWSNPRLYADPERHRLMHRFDIKALAAAEKTPGEAATAGKAQATAPPQPVKREISNALLLYKYHPEAFKDAQLLAAARQQVGHDQYQYRARHELLHHFGPDELAPAEDNSIRKRRLCRCLVAKSRTDTAGTRLPGADAGQRSLPTSGGPRPRMTRTAPTPWSSGCSISRPISGAAGDSHGGWHAICGLTPSLELPEQNRVKFRKMLPSALLTEMQFQRIAATA